MSTVLFMLLQPPCLQPLRPSARQRSHRGPLPPGLQALLEGGQGCGCSISPGQLPCLPWAWAWVSAKWPQEGLCHMLFTCGQFLFGFQGYLLAVSKQLLPEPSGDFRSFHLGLRSMVVVPCSEAKSGRGFYKNALSQRAGQRRQRG